MSMILSLLYWRGCIEQEHFVDNSRLKVIFEFYISFFLIALLTYEFIIECDMVLRYQQQ